jgi:hypothetical protein
MSVELMLHENGRTFMTNAGHDVTTGFMGTKITNVRVATIDTLLTKATNSPLLWLRYCADTLDIFQIKISFIWVPTLRQWTTGHRRFAKRGVILNKISYIQTPECPIPVHVHS